MRCGAEYYKYTVVFGLGAGVYVCLALFYCYLLGTGMRSVIHVGSRPPLYFILFCHAVDNTWAGYR